MTSPIEPLPVDNRENGHDLHLVHRTDEYGIYKRTGRGGHLIGFDVFRILVTPSQPPWMYRGTPPTPEEQELWQPTYSERMPGKSAWGKQGLSVVNEEQARRVLDLAMNVGLSFGDISIGRAYLAVTDADIPD